MATQGSDFSGQEVIYPPVAEGQSASRALVATTPFGPAAAGFGGFAPRGPEILTGNFNQTWLVNCLRRRWLLASLMGLLIGSAVAGLLMWLFPESSRITSYLQIKGETTNSFFDENKRVINQKEIEREAMNHVALLRSPLVLEAALQKPEIAQLDAVQYFGNDAVLWLLDELKVSFPGEGEILEVRYEGDQNPDDMVKIVNAVIAAYRDKVLWQDRLLAASTRDDLGTVLEQTKTDLRRDLEDFKTRGEVSGYLNFQEFELPKLKSDIALFQSQLLGLQKEQEDIEVLKDVAVQNARSPSALETAVQQEVDADPMIGMYQQKIFEADQAIQARATTGRNPNNTVLRSLQAQKEQMQAQMDQYRADAEKKARDRLARIPNESLRTAMTEYQIRAKSIAERKTELEQKLKDAEGKITEMAAGNPELDMLKSNIEGQQELVTNLQSKILEWRALKQAEDKRSAAGEDSDFESVRVIQQAIATPQINKYERWAIAGIGGSAALALTCYGIALMEFRRRRLNGPNDMDEGLGIRVLGVLPATSLKALGSNNLAATQVAESIDNVRATIMHDSTSRPRQVVMVTSAASMEGSTTVASSLALSLARAGRRTLLIDGDLRAPALHKLFGVALEDGLSEVLRSEIDLADAVRPTNSEGLYLLTAGVCDMDAIHALATDQPQAVFEKLRDQFDFVIIDAPPVLGISDSLSLGHYIDGAILTVLRDHSEIRKIYQATEVLKSLGIRLIGAVVNGMPLKADRRVVRLHQASQQRTPRLPAQAES
jgi:capsular exopolysaccharide synthesis family protein